VIGFEGDFALLEMEHRIEGLLRELRRPDVLCSQLKELAL